MNDVLAKRTAALPIVLSWRGGIAESCLLLLQVLVTAGFVLWPLAVVPAHGGDGGRNHESVPSGQDATPAGPATVGVGDPTGQSPPTISWLPYPAAPLPGFHWRHSGSPAIRLDPTTRQPLPDQWTGAWVLVRDGYTMPKMQ